jgi:hypothetical protein
MAASGGLIRIDDLKLVIVELKTEVPNYKQIPFKNELLAFESNDPLQIYGCTRNSPDITTDSLKPIHEFSDTFFYYEKQSAENKTKTGGLIFKGENLVAIHCYATDDDKRSFCVRLHAFVKWAID